MAVDRAYIDTSIILTLLLETEKSSLAQEILEAHSEYDFIISGIAINEALYVATYEYYRQKGEIKGRHSLRKLIAEKGIPRGSARYNRLFPERPRRRNNKRLL